MYDPGNMAGRILFLALLLVPNIQGARGVGNTITSTEPLSGDQTIVSSAGKFELGFFQPGNSSSYYAGIWFKQLPVITPVWVANRDSPVSDKSAAQFKISDGNLVLTNGSSSTVWSTDLIMSTSRSVQAVLQDDGNLVLVEGSTTLWQSFDNPTHIWLPGAKLGRNKRTKRRQALTSWRNTQDPARGLYSLQIDPNGSSSFVLLWNNTEQYETTGLWDEKQQTFALVPDLSFRRDHTFAFVDNENESYGTYSANDDGLFRFFIGVTGKVQSEVWLNSSQQWTQFWAKPEQQCEVLGLCGAFGICSENSLSSCNCLQGFVPKSKEGWDLNDYSQGCVRKTRISCGKDKFWKYHNMKLPLNPEFVNASTLEECQSSCKRNCSCNAYAYDSQGCSIWTGNLLNMKQLSDGDANGTTLYLRLAPSEFSSKTNKLIVAIITGSVVGTLALLLLVGFLVYWVKKWRSTVTVSAAMEGSLVAFAYRDLQTATKNFSKKLGGGGFGTVFKGTLPDSSEVAVKKLESISQGEKQFRAEVSTIGNIQHVNLVRLRGFCSHDTRKLLVYDYMPNGSLDALLFQGKGKLLDWKTRYGVVLGIARGLAYLHDHCRDCIIHCDIKPENILLDADLCPKVADFGLAKLVGRDFSRVLTTMRGTIGYLAPEWLSGVPITAKADVYSYGMLIFELVWGRRNIEKSKHEDEDETFRFFPSRAARILMEGGDILRIVDPRLERNADAEQVTKVCKLGYWCIQDDEKNRPSMGQVVQILEGFVDVSMPPIPRSIQIYAGDEESVVFFTDSSTSQSSSIKSSASA